jgi:hypothetical protein
MASLVKRQFHSGPVYYIQYYLGGKQRRVRAAESFQIAKEKLRQFESAQARGNDLPLPTRTPLVDVLEDYVRHIRTYKTPKSAQTNIYYLQAAFGPICEGLRLTYRNVPLNPTAPRKRLGRQALRHHSRARQDVERRIVAAQDQGQSSSSHQQQSTAVSGSPATSRRQDPVALSDQERNPRTGTRLYSLPDEDGTIYWLAWSADSRRVAIARDNGNIAVWNLNTVDQILARLGL